MIKTEEKIELNTSLTNLEILWKIKPVQFLFFSVDYFSYRLKPKFKRIHESMYVFEGQSV